VTAPAGGPVHASCPTCGGTVLLGAPQNEHSGEIADWVRALRSRENRRRGVTDAQTYATRRQAQRQAASYRRQLGERGLRAESVTRPRYCWYGRWGWQFVIWREGERPPRSVEQALSARQRAIAARDAEHPEWW
jgi:hypothetical protein